MAGVRVDQADLLLVHLAHEELLAYDNRCPHAGSRLSEGELRGATLRCPTHEWLFDVRTGCGINPRDCKLQQYPVKVVDGNVLVQLGRVRAKRQPY